MEPMFENVHEDTYEDISPLYMTQLADKVENKLWGFFEGSKYKKVRRYIERWHSEEAYSWENFEIYFIDDDHEKIDLGETLAKMPNEILIKIAIDMGVETPGLIPEIPRFKNVLKESNENALQMFIQATKLIYEKPDEAVVLSESTLEGVVKTICNDSRLQIDSNLVKAGPQKKLIKELIKALDLSAGVNMPPELSSLAEHLREASDSIREIRNSKTAAHGKIQDEYVIDDPLWAEFIVNSCATLGLFLYFFYKRKFPEDSNSESDDGFNTDNIPF